MNKIIFLLLFLSCLTLLAHGQVNVSTDALYFDNTANNSTIVNITSGDEWDFIANVDWIQVEKVSSNMLSIETLSANDKTNKRYAQIVITQAGKTKSISIQQEASEPRLIASKESVTIPYKGGNNTISISSNMSWEIMQSPQWCILNITDNDVNIKVDQNDSKKSRAGVIIIKAENHEISIPIKQRGNGIFDKIQDKANDII